MRRFVAWQTRTIIGITMMIPLLLPMTISRATLTDHVRNSKSNKNSSEHVALPVRLEVSPLLTTVIQMPVRRYLLRTKVNM